MSGEHFYDTNVLIYAFSTNDPRAGRAEALLADGGVIGVQILNEFANVARRKLGWDWAQIEAALEVVKDLVGPVGPLTTEIHAKAVQLARDHSLAFYDALVVAAAADAHCSVLFSEDLQDGRTFGQLIVRNPFR